MQGIPFARDRLKWYSADDSKTSELVVHMYKNHGGGVGLKNLCFQSVPCPKEIDLQILNDSG